MPGETPDLSLINNLVGKTDATNKALEDLAKKIDALSAKNAELEKAAAAEREQHARYQAAVGRVMAAQGRPAPEDVRVVLAAHGKSAAEIDTILATQAKPAQETADDEDVGDAKIEELAQQVGKVRSDLAQQRSKTLVERFNEKVDSIVSGHKGIQAAINALKASGKQTEADALYKSAREAVEAKARRDLASYAESTTPDGNRPAIDENTIENIVPKAVGPLEPLLSAIGSMSFAGRAPETGVSEFAKKVLESKPVEPPVVKPGQTLRDVDADLDKYVNDAVAREFASAAVGTETKA